MAEDCPNREKSFGIGTSGTVLGIIFNTKNLSWQLPNTKADGIIALIDEFIGKRTSSLKDVQKLHGKLSDFAQMCDFMKGYRFNLSKLLGSFEGKEDCKKLIPKFFYRRSVYLEKVYHISEKRSTVEQTCMWSAILGNEIHVRRGRSCLSLVKRAMQKSHLTQ